MVGMRASSAYVSLRFWTDIDGTRAAAEINPLAFGLEKEVVGITAGWQAATGAP
jgi:hypothetical protein